MCGKGTDQQMRPEGAVMRKHDLYGKRFLALLTSAVVFMSSGTGTIAMADEVTVTAYDAAATGDDQGLILEDDQEGLRQEGLQTVPDEGDAGSILQDDILTDMTESEGDMGLLIEDRESDQIILPDGITVDDEKRETAAETQTGKTAPEAETVSSEDIEQPEALTGESSADPEVGQETEPEEAPQSFAEEMAQSEIAETESLVESEPASETGLTDEAAVYEAEPASETGLTAETGADEAETAGEPSESIEPAETEVPAYADPAETEGPDEIVGESEMAGSEEDEIIPDAISEEQTEEDLIIMEETEADNHLASAQTGSCGTNATYSFDDQSGVLTISGSGELTSQTDPTKYPWYAFKDSVTGVVVKAGIKNIPTAAFYNDYPKLQSVSIDAETVDSGAFNGCYALTDVTLGGHVKKLDDYAFGACPSITSVSIPASLTDLSGMTFYGDTGLTAYTVAAGNASYRSISGMLVSKDGATLISMPLGLTGTVSIPNGIKVIGDSACQNSRASEIMIPSSVTTLKDWAFAMSSVTKATVPATVTSIGYGPYSGCSDLEYLNLQASIAEVPYRTTWQCYSLKTLIIGDAFKDIDNQAFAYCFSLTDVTLSKNLKSTGTECFGNCTALQSIRLPEGLETVAYRTFVGCKELTSVYIPRSVTNIYQEAFLGCDKLNFQTPSWLYKTGTGGKAAYVSAVSYDESVTRMYSYAFQVLSLVNKERAKTGAKALTMDADLMETAMYRAQEITVYFEHFRPVGSLAFTANDRMTAENIAMWQSTPADVMDSWMHSEGHKANILDKNSTVIGIGCVKYNGSYYWVQCFGQTGGRTATASSYQDKVVNSPVRIAADGSTMDLIITMPDSILEGKTCTIEVDNRSYHYDETFAGLMVDRNQYYDVPLKTSNLTITSSDSTVASVKNGVLTARKPGKVTITVSLKGAPSIKKTAVIRITEDKVAKKKRVTALRKKQATVKLNVSSIPLQVKKSTSVVKAKGLKSWDRVTKWYSSNKKVASVSSKGVITGKKKGKAYIYVRTYYGAKARVLVKVQNGKVKISKLKVNKQKITLKRKKTYKLKVSWSPLTYKGKVTYKSSNRKVAAVSSKGVIKARKKGKATITVKCGNKSVKVKVTVR